MDSFLKTSTKDRDAVFAEAAKRHHLPFVMIEKDFWVCWTLKQIFDSPILASYLTFKGGTSLSKAYYLIERFSEDLDLTISVDRVTLT